MMLRRTAKFNFCNSVKTHYRYVYEWQQPNGYDTGIKIYNDYLKKKVSLIFPNKDYVKWYMCGPTVYDNTHIGHASCYVRLDIIRRVLQEFFGINPVVAMGVTDIAENITDKAKKLHMQPMNVSKKYEKEFFAQMAALNVLPPTFVLNVSAHMDQIIEFINKLVNENMAYKTVNGDVYFKVKFDKSYGRFREINEDDVTEQVSGKRHKFDFSLWKAKNDYSFWSPWSKGIPGWHIECSAMASHVFGSSIDIHSGGSDLIFPHHENEEAQSTCYHRCDQWVNYWLHVGLLNIDNKKMSKSLMNFIPVSEFLKNNDPHHFRMLCCLSDYGSMLNYSEENLKLGRETFERVIYFLNIAESYVKGTWILGNINEAELLEVLDRTKSEVKKHLADNFCTSQAIHSLMSLIKNGIRMLSEEPKSNVRSPAVVAVVNSYVKDFFKAFGFKFTDDIKKTESTSAFEAIVDATVNFRSQIRGLCLKRKCSETKKILELCDGLRKELTVLGVKLTDIGPNHTHWSCNNSEVGNWSVIKILINNLVSFTYGMAQLANESNNVVLKDQINALCRSSFMFLATVGISVGKSEGGHIYWKFQKPDPQCTSKFVAIVCNTFKFYDEIKIAVESLEDEEIKKKVVSLCDSAIADIESYGVSLNPDDSQALSVRNDNVKGTSVLQNLIDLQIHFLIQIERVLPFCRDENTVARLKKLCTVSRGKIKLAGVISFRTNGTGFSWTVRDTENTVNLLPKIIKVTTNLLFEVRKVLINCKDDEFRTFLVNVCKETQNDLNSIGLENEIWKCLRYFCEAF